MTSSLSDNAGRLCPPRPGQCQCYECCPVWPECGAVGPGWAADCRKELVAHWKAECGLAIDWTLLLTLHSAHTLDTLGSRTARKQPTHT
ncbi:acyl-CoA dehydrogenase family member 11 isoform X2 [Oncorhynchus masou masou]|uniref:acyl-CoA dehydrogenase family member 11 isoform X2 n=1 Tax=Oncorhynchus masou masou TaxID=90313 RepID=UPI003183A421